MWMSWRSACVVWQHRSAWNSVHRGLLDTKRRKARPAQATGSNGANEYYWCLTDRMLITTRLTVPTSYMGSHVKPTGHFPFPISLSAKLCRLLRRRLFPAQYRALLQALALACSWLTDALVHGLPIWGQGTVAVGAFRCDTEIP